MFVPTLRGVLLGEFTNLLMVVVLVEIDKSGSKFLSTGIGHVRTADCRGLGIPVDTYAWCNVGVSTWVLSTVILN